VTWRPFLRRAGFPSLFGLSCDKTVTLATIAATALPLALAMRRARRSLHNIVAFVQFH
jgi:hypothetical protein